MLIFDKRIFSRCGIPRHSASPETDVITGFNTDIEYNGVTYHVQTEDKGLDRPLILSLVYTGGEILASKRSPYDDLISAGFDEKVLTERLKRQHKLICAAISQGRIDDLKRMSMREPAAKTENAETPQKNGARKKDLIEVAETRETAIPVEVLPTPFTSVEDFETGEPVLEIPVAVVDEADDVHLETAAEEPALIPKSEPNSDFPLDYSEIADENDMRQIAVYLRLFDEREYRGGDRVDLKIQVTNGANLPQAGAEIMVKVLGSAFRPLIFHAKTGEKGTAVINLQLPRFRAGRAALLVRAIVADKEAELRRIILQG